MREKIYQIIFLFGLIIVVFCFSFSRDIDIGKIKIDADSEVGMELLETEVSDSETSQAELSHSEDIKIEAMETETLKEELTEELKAELNMHFGVYRITKFFATEVSFANLNITEQEADMMLGRIVEITPECLRTYGPERGLGNQEGRYGFTNYMVESYRIDNVHYGYRKNYTKLPPEVPGAVTLRYVVPEELFEQLEGVIITPQLSEPYGRQCFYTFTDQNILVLYSEVACEYFLLERCEEEPKEEHPEWNSMEAKKLLKEIYGTYQVTEFLPTKFFPITTYGYRDEQLSKEGEQLSQEEADITVGRIVTISEDLFVTLDNWWMLNSPRTSVRHKYEDWENWWMQAENRPWVAEAEIEKPDYRVKTVWADEIYGIRDGMLSDNLVQQEYVEIDVYPGYWSELKDVSLPQMYLVNDGRIILYAMGQYFLLERTDSVKAVVHEKDLSVWIGRYVYIEGDSTYQIKIQEKSSGEYEAEIEADVHKEYKVSGSTYKDAWYTKNMAEVYGNGERISFVLKEYLEGEEEWNIGTVLLRFKRDVDTGNIYTYWGVLDSDNINLDTSNKQAGKICFKKTG